MRSSHYKSVPSPEHGAKAFSYTHDWPTPLFSHQEEAIRRLAAGRNVVVATGTRSGKTEAYLLPILLHLLHEQHASDRRTGVHALVLYPMNALANDQRRRLGEFHEVLEKRQSSFRFTFGRYTGESPEDARDDYRKARQQLLNLGVRGASTLPAGEILGHKRSGLVETVAQRISPQRIRPHACNFSGPRRV